jgi:hypothetical protein
MAVKIAVDNECASGNNRFGRATNRRPHMDSSPLAGWENFYVIAGSSAGGLAGLTFVVITLSAEARRVNPNGLRLFVTPTIVHFVAVLGWAAFLSMPRQSILSLSVSFGIGGTVGLVYIGTITAGIRRLEGDYVPVHEDWTWNVVIPAIAYGALLAVAFVIWCRTAWSMYAVAAAMVLLMFAGIHNAWDVAVWNILSRKEDAS